MPFFSRAVEEWGTERTQLEPLRTCERGQVSLTDANLGHEDRR